MFKLFLSAAIITVISSSPFCEPDNQFREHCLAVEYCNDFTCRQNKCGKFDIGLVKLIKVKDAKIIPSCAFSSIEELKYIHIVNSNVHTIASEAFVNLPNLENVLLSFNYIRELRNGIFKNVSLLSLDLSWNRIMYIQKDAFNGVSGLKYLNLSRNEFTTLPVQHLPSSLIELNLSHNFFTTMVLNYARYPNLTDIDLSYNGLKRVALLFETTIKKIDLTNNNLRDIDYFEVNYCETLKIPANKFTEVPQFLTYSNIRNVSLYPNPWRCDELHSLWTHLQNNQVNIEEDASNLENIPICVANSQGATSPQIFSRLEKSSQECNDDTHCNKKMVCRGAKCWDPCKESVCDSGSICQVNNHKFKCPCSENLKRDPRDVYAPCVEGQCFLDDDCEPGHYCDSGRKCHYFPPVVTKPPNQSPIAVEEPIIVPEEPLTTPSPPPASPWWFYEIPRLEPSKI